MRYLEERSVMLKDLVEMDLELFVPHDVFLCGPPECKLNRC